MAIYKAHRGSGAAAGGGGGAGSDTTAIHDDTAGEISLVAEKASPVAADLMLIEDSQAANAKKRVQVGNLPATDSTAIHDNVASEISAVAAKATPVGADFLLIEDSQAANVKKSATIAAVQAILDHGGLAGITDDDHTIYSLVTGTRAFTDNVTITQAVHTSGSTSAFTVTGGAHTTLAAGTDAPMVHLNAAATAQFSTGAVAALRAIKVSAPTYAFVGASVVTDAATVAISGPPIAGANATLTEAWALWVESGDIGVETGRIVVSAAGTAAAPPLQIGTNAYGFFRATNEIQVTLGGAAEYKFAATTFYPPDNVNDLGITKTAAWKNLFLAGYCEIEEMTAPAGTTDAARLFCQDSGGGKTQLMVIFGSGTAIQIAIEA